MLKIWILLLSMNVSFFLLLSFEISSHGLPFHDPTQGFCVQGWPHFHRYCYLGTCLGLIFYSLVLFRLFSTYTRTNGESSIC